MCLVGLKASSLILSRSHFQFQHRIFGWNVEGLVFCRKQILCSFLLGSERNELIPAEFIQWLCRRWFPTSVLLRHLRWTAGMGDLCFSPIKIRRITSFTDVKENTKGNTARWCGLKKKKYCLFSQFTSLSSSPFPLPGLMSMLWWWEAHGNKHSYSNLLLSWLLCDLFSYCYIYF